MIGEATLNLKRTINKMEKEGYIEVPKTYIICYNANMKDEERGNIMFSMTIVTMEDELSNKINRKVDLRTLADLSCYFRSEVLMEAMVIYEQS